MLPTDHRSTASGGFFVSAADAGGRPRLPLPVDAVVDPRIGAHGPTLLTLADGTSYRAIAFGAPIGGGGDLVVNTAQTGYQEICTDPVVRRPDRRHDLPADRQLRAPGA